MVEYKIESDFSSPKKILIALPSNSSSYLVPAKYTFSVLNLSKEFIRKFPKHTLEIKWFLGNSTEIQRLQIVHYCIKNHFDAVLMLDDDMTFPEDILVKMFKHYITGKQIISGLYYSRTHFTNGQLIAFVNPINTTGWQSEWIPNTVYEIKSFGTGCLFVDTEVFKKFPKDTPCFAITNDPKKEFKIDIIEDLYFSKMCFDLGIKAFCDTSILCEHISFLYLPTDVYRWYAIKNGGKAQ